MRTIMKLHKNNTGDTIVEVMIAIVVLGAALGGAFAISNRSQLATQANHERFQAQVLANGQAERLRLAYKAHVDSGSERADFDNPSAGTCLNSAAAWESNAVNCDAILSWYSIRLTKLNNGLALGDAGAAVGSALTYRILVEWDSLTNKNSKDRVELIYGL
jgi:Tfp pilus assembly protein PilV